MYGEGNNIENNTNRWVLLREPTEENVDYIKALGFNIIVGDTREMLTYISEFVKTLSVDGEDKEEPTDDKTIALLKRYQIPLDDENLPSYPLSKFFLEYTPSWSHIYSGVIPKTTNYKKAENSIASGSDTIVMGIRGAGKTTLMMQLLVNLSTDKLKHMLIRPQLSKHKVI